MPNTREKLIELLESAFESFIDDPYCIPDEREFADHLIANGVTILTEPECKKINIKLPKEIVVHPYKPKWIPVTERLPKREDANLYESVLAINKEDGVVRCWIWDVVVDYSQKFTHWMPLPEAPKGE